MDALSSQASAAGYKSVLMAAERLGKFFPMMMTAAGTVAPARVLVMGAGVAGLQAIATARRLGAVVSAYDVPPLTPRAPWAVARLAPAAVWWTLTGSGVTSIARMNGFSPSRRAKRARRDRRSERYRPRALEPLLQALPRIGES